MTYQPTESQIERLVNPKTPRELAIGYLRIKARELELESRLKVMSGISEIQNELMGAMAEGVCKMTEQPRPDADDWHPHDGSPKRPKGVGKRDLVAYEWELGNQGGNAIGCGQMILWGLVTRYRITERAPKKKKRRKVWVVESHGDILGAWHSEGVARAVCNESGGTLFTAKLKEVTK